MTTLAAILLSTVDTIALAAIAYALWRDGRPPGAR
jgi:hypothetical protein